MSNVSIDHKLTNEEIIIRLQAGWLLCSSCFGGWMLLPPKALHQSERLYVHMDQKSELESHGLIEIIPVGGPCLARLVQTK